MPDNRLTTLNAVHLSETTKDWAEALNDNFAELDERKTDIGNTATLVHDADYVHTDRNFTAEEKTKLGGVAAGAQVNVLEGVQVNGTDLIITNKKVNIPYDLSSFITASVDNLTNYYKKSETYTQAEVNTLIGNLKTIQIQVVQTLPATGQSNIIYLVPKTGSTTGSYTEYIWVADTSSFEEIGDTDVDLSNYPTIAEMNTAIATALTSYYTSAQIDTLLGGKADKTVATESANGLMSSTDKTKLNGISAGANKVEASNTNGNIKIDGVETPVYVAPVIDQVTEYSFTSDDSRWGALSSGVYTLTIPSTKRPFICYNGDGEQVMATIGYNGTNITVKTDTKFAGKVLAI